MKSQTAAFPSVVAAKQVAANQLAYYRSMMSSGHVKSQTAAFPSVVAAKQVAANQLAYYRSMMSSGQPGTQAVPKAISKGAAKSEGTSAQPNIKTHS